MMDKKVDPQSVCARFERADWSLIEEPEVCENCARFNDEDSTCEREE